MSNDPRTLDDYLALQYTFYAIADVDGGWVIEFPDLPGCLSQAETWEEVGVMAEDARRCWLKAVYEDKQVIPLPTHPSFD